MRFWGYLVILSAFILMSSCAQKTTSKKVEPNKKITTVKPKVSVAKASIIRDDAEIFKAASFDSQIIGYVKSGGPYTISKDPIGPFYKIKLQDGRIGYIADSDLDIEGKGRVQPKSVFDNVDPLAGKPAEVFQAFQDDEEDYESDYSQLERTYHGIFLSLINYHENTMGGVQIADLFALGYKFVPYYSDYGSSVSWDVNVAFKAPDYYEKITSASTSGMTIWGGVQIAGVNIWAKDRLIRYGIGPFLKYSHYSIKGLKKSYVLQDLSVGAMAEAGLIFKFSKTAFDVGLRYYWDKEAYGALTAGFLF